MKSRALYLALRGGHRADMCATLLKVLASEFWPTGFGASVLLEIGTGCSNDRP